MASPQEGGEEVEEGIPRWQVDEWREDRGWEAGECKEEQGSIVWDTDLASWAGGKGALTLLSAQTRVTSLSRPIEATATLLWGRE